MLIQKNSVKIVLIYFFILSYDVPFVTSTSTFISSIIPQLPLIMDTLIKVMILNNIVCLQLLDDLFTANTFSFHISFVICIFRCLFSRDGSWWSLILWCGSISLGSPFTYFLIFPMTRSVRPLDGWSVKRSVGWLVGMFVSRSVMKISKRATLPYSYQSTCFISSSLRCFCSHYFGSLAMLMGWKFMISWTIRYIIIFLTETIIYIYTWSYLVYELIEIFRRLWYWNRNIFFTGVYILQNTMARGGGKRKMRQ